MNWYGLCGLVRACLKRLDCSSFGVPDIVQKINKKKTIH